MNETFERPTPAERVDRQPRAARAAEPERASLAEAGSETAPGAAAAASPESQRTGLRGKQARWLPLVVPGFALLLLAGAALILGMAETVT